LIKLALNAANYDVTEESRTLKDRIVHKTGRWSMYNFKLKGSPRYSKRIRLISNNDGTDPIHEALNYFNAKYDYSTGLETTKVKDPIIRV
jgi:hypothetical protein